MSQPGGVWKFVAPRSEMAPVGVPKSSGTMKFRIMNRASSRDIAQYAGPNPPDALNTEQALKKLTAVTRLSAGIAHELKNPLNAAVIHLELLKQQLATGTADSSSAAGHVAVISAQMRRLDEVVQGFLRFIRPENLKLEVMQL